MTGVAILWDIENVNPADSTMLAQYIKEYAGDFGDISAMVAIGDWERISKKETRRAIFDCGFELLYIPSKDTRRRNIQKNSSDIMLVAKATEMIFQLPHITTYVLVSGDADFRPLIIQLKRHGKRSVIICNSQSASEDLLTMADRYIDYRDLLPDDSSDLDTPDIDEEDHPQQRVKMSEQDLFQLLEVAVQHMERNGKIPTAGSVKIRMKLLNQDFPDHELKKGTWRHFLESAQRNGSIRLEDGGSDSVVHMVDKHEPEYQKVLHDVMRSLDSKNNWINFAAISRQLQERNINIRQLIGISSRKFKKHMVHAAKAGVIEIRNRGVHWEARLPD